MTAQLTRRKLLGSAACVALGGCNRDRTSPVEKGREKKHATDTIESGTDHSVGEIASLIASSDRNDLLPKLVGMFREGATLAALTVAAVQCAVDRCHHESPSGVASHALLGLGPAFRLSQRMPAQRAPIPVLQAVMFVAAEVRRSPYGPTPYTIPTLPEASLESIDLAAALEVGDMKPSEAWLATHLKHNSWRDAVTALFDLSTRRYGHVGHGAIFVEHAVEHIQHHGQSLASALRAPIRYLATHWPDDDTLTRVTAAEHDVGPTTRARLVRQKLQRAENSLDVARDNTAIALDLMTHLDRAPLTFTEVHIATATHATEQAARWLVSEGHHELAHQVIMRGAAWFDRIVAGDSEFGPIERWQPPRDIHPRGDLANMIMSGSREDIYGAASSLQTIDKELTQMLIESACAQGRTTIQHSIKLVDLILRHVDHGGDTAVALRAAGAALAGAAGARDPLYDEIVEALDVPIHAALGSAS